MKSEFWIQIFSKMQKVGVGPVLVENEYCRQANTKCTVGTILRTYFYPTTVSLLYYFTI